MRSSTMTNRNFDGRQFSVDQELKLITLLGILSNGFMVAGPMRWLPQSKTINDWVSGVLSFTKSFALFGRTFRRPVFVNMDIFVPIRRHQVK